MIRTALKGIASRRMRTALTALSIVLGVAMISGALTLSDTMRHAASALTSSSYKGTDAVVSARTAFDTKESENASTPTLPAGLLAKVRALPHVGVAVGDLTNYETKIVDVNGKVRGRITVAADADADGENSIVLGPPQAATMTVLIGMFLLGLFIALGTWVLSWSDHVKKELTVKVYFAQTATPVQEYAVRQQLVKDHQRVKKVVFVSKEQAERTMAKKFPALYNTPLPSNETS